MTQDRDLPSRRRFLAQGMAGVSLTGLLPRELFAEDVRPHHPPRVRRVIQLCMHGGPSSIDLFDEKPTLNERRGQDLPESVRTRLALPMMTRDQGRWPLVGAAHPFVEHGASGIRMSELLPHIGSLADQITLVRSLTTDPLDHAGAISQMSTGHADPGAPALGSWIAHALGSENEVLPGYVVLRSGAGGPALSPRAWGAGSLPARARARSLRAGGHGASGVDADTRRAQVDALSELDRLHHAAHGDPHTLDHSATYQRAGRLERSLPAIADLSDEPPEVFAAYGARPGEASFANHCMLARRLCESGVRYVQLFHREWDHHRHLPTELALRCREVDQPSAMLVKDLAQRGLLEDTLVLWSGEFGRSPYAQGPLHEDGAWGRDHWPHCFSAWMAGGGVKRGHVYGETCEFGAQVVRDPIHVRDLQATLFYLLGLDARLLRHRHAGRDQRLAADARVIGGLLG